ncbi:MULTISPECIES: S53 family peptidase [Subtercola]|uniref:Peptidase S53 n=1 Tax=Subtercola vilae TaxID=2056433 RepID=A0A4T2C9D6_9MICO|nr:MULTISPECIES: S53 family peptidase [Subtercola]MEA9985472.1 S53 family peptidase [Subtercola sp. RTI3]TIH39306.1 peptidase S53 [Subtercola vilae]
MTETEGARGDHERIELVPLAGSERPPARQALAAARALPPAALVDATVVLRREASGQLGAAPADVELVTSTLEGLGLSVLLVDAASRRVRVEGTAAQVGRVFGTSLEAVTSSAPDGQRVEHRHRTGGLSIPVALEGVVTAVLGLDDRPQARAQFRVAEARAATVSYTPVELGQIYRFPADTDGSGQTVAIVELGGGYQQSDLDTYFGGLGVGSPRVTAVGVDGAKNVPGGDPTGADGEVLLDIEVVGGLSPKASIVVYFAPNTDAGFLDAVATAAHSTPTPAAMSISWGQSEDEWTPQARTALDDALADAATLGVTVTAAAGDNGSSDGAADGRNHADFPASSPHALACGGTSLHATATRVNSETVWNNGAGKGATGGGVSDVFGLPSWQSAAGVPAGAAPNGPGGRGVPDVAANADPATGYEVLVDGKRAVYGGTSAVAPLWAALVARLVQSLGTPLGLLQPRLYALAAASTGTGTGAGSSAAGLRDVTEGSNGAFTAGPGWDACTGLGVPDGTALLAALAATKPGA